LMYFEKLPKSLVICIHSSRVGHRIRVCVLLSFISVKWMDGRPKAAVFPVPVCAVAIKSWEDAIKCGMVLAWIGVGISKPISVIALRISGCSRVCLKLSIYIVCLERKVGSLFLSRELIIKFI